MTWEECLDKAFEAYLEGLINKNQIEKYAEHLFIINKK
jgi:hypothetical protein